MSKKSENVLPQADDLQDLMEVSQDSMEVAMGSYSSWLQNACQVQLELWSFVNKRICEDIEMPTRIAGCKSPADVVEHQVSFAQQMITDYADEGRKIMELMSAKSGVDQDEMGRSPTP